MNNNSLAIGLIGAVGAGIGVVAGAYKFGARQQEKKDKSKIDQLEFNRRVLNNDIVELKEFINKVIKNQDPQTPQELNKYSYDLTQRAREGKLDPVVGRDEEIQLLITNIIRRDKPHAVVLGNPGSGKTTLAQGLAQRIVEGKVPEQLRDKRVIVLNVTELTAGIGIVGEIEKRVQTILKEIQSSGNVILFIDEIHTIMGAGAANNHPNDLPNMLKPVLTDSNSNLRVIGATTNSEYEQHLAKDGAFTRRFAVVRLSTPNDENCKKMVMQKKELYEKYHGCVYTDEAIDAVIVESNKLPGYQPDKAFSLLDAVGAGSQINRKEGDRQVVISCKEIEETAAVISSAKAPVAIFSSQVDKLVELLAKQQAS